jgi:ATP-binding cassette, subfamily F, member 3
MIVLQASHVTKQFDGHEVLIDGSVAVGHRDRVALVGPNGAGKSTLLRILTGEMQADTGDVSLAKGAEIGYIAQYIQADDAMTVYDFVLAAFDELRAMEGTLRSLEEKMAQPEIYSDEAKFYEVSGQYDRLRQTFEEANGYAVDARVRRVLDGLRFTPDMARQSVQSLSGGQKTRLSLARLLASEPSVLVLDEPTNYLDTDTLTWLEEYLKGYDGAILVVSHDRYFLDQVATDIVELMQGRTSRYVGNYSDYVEEKVKRLEAEEKRYEAQQAEVTKMNNFVQKNIVRASTTKRAQSRRKLLEKMTLIERPNGNTPKLALSFTALRPSGKDVLRIEQLAIGYPDKTLATDINLYVGRGMRIAIVGSNGVGKTTLLRTLLEEQPPLAGESRFGHHVAIGYYDQEQADLALNKTVIDALWDDYPTLTQTVIRTALGRFLFRGEDVNKPVAGLSGGERSRLNLCRLMLQGANTLLFDEPTNHLDLLAKEVLEDALQSFEGTLLFVSHDRYFIDAIATHVAVLTPVGFKVYIGNYSEYREKLDEEAKWREVERASVAAELIQGTTNETREASASQGPAALNDPVAASASKAGGGSRRIRSSELRKARELVSRLEANVDTLEKRQVDIAHALNEAAMQQDVELTKGLQAELTQAEAEYAETVEAWENASLALESLEAEAE